MRTRLLTTAAVVAVLFSTSLPGTAAAATAAPATATVTTAAQLAGSGVVQPYGWDDWCSTFPWWPGCR